MTTRLLQASFAFAALAFVLSYAGAGWWITPLVVAEVWTLAGFCVRSWQGK